MPICNYLQSNCKWRWIYWTIRRKWALGIDWPKLNENHLNKNELAIFFCLIDTHAYAMGSAISEMLMAILLFSHKIITDSAFMCVRVLCAIYIKKFFFSNFIAILTYTLVFSCFFPFIDLTLLHDDCTCSFSTDRFLLKLSYRCNRKCYYFWLFSCSF